MKSIFLGDKANIKHVYTQEITDNLVKNAGLCTEVYTKSEVVSGKVDTRHTEYVFSTWGMPEFSEEEIKAFFPNLKAVFYAAGSVQAFARPFLNRGVKVFSAWAANAVPVAEYTVAEIVLANKGFYRCLSIISREEYHNARNAVGGYIGNYNSKVGIIGAGMIGKLVINMLKDYKLDVLVFDPFLSEEDAKKLNVEKCSIEKIFTECNIISNHLANNEDTKNMLNGSLFKKMPPNSTFINTGRGAQIAESELIETLKKRKDITALLDVTYPEPPETNSELYRLKNCILTPHIAGSIGNEVFRMAEFMENEFNNLVSGNATYYEVNLKMLETMA